MQNSKMILHSVLAPVIENEREFTRILSLLLVAGSCKENTL
jgi:hypothetical protein